MKTEKEKQIEQLIRKCGKVRHDCCQTVVGFEIGTNLRRTVTNGRRALIRMEHRGDVKAIPTVRPLDAQWYELKIS